MKPKHLVAIYFLIQAVGTTAWWAALICMPTTIDFFKPAAWPAETLLTFWLADVVLVIGGSILVSASVAFNARWSAVAVWSLAGAVWYPTLYCVAVSVWTGQAWMASGLMVTMAGLTLSMATIHGTSNQQAATFRVMRLSRTASVLWTFGQLIVFWGTFLWVLPMAVFELERCLDVPTFSHPGQTVAASIMLCMASLLGFWSAWTMAVIGSGTPLPTATAPKLVIAGPYQHVRNPMALAGILQGLAVGWLLGSYGVIAYALLGGFVWHVLVRPCEERDLAARFGDGFRNYQQNTGLWWPRWSTRLKNTEPHTH